MRKRMLVHMVKLFSWSKEVGAVKKAGVSKTFTFTRRKAEAPAPVEVEPVEAEPEEK